MKIATICVSGVEAAALDRKSITMGLAGATVEFEYTDPMWSGLTKNVVFDGATTVAVYNAGTVVEVPSAVLAVKNTPVRVGVCGIGGDGSVVVPTIWAEIGVVRSSAFGQFPPPAEVPLPVWAQVMASIGDLNNLTTKAKENLVAAINEAAASGGGGGVDANTLQEAINAALAQAKASGEFDGEDGTPGKDGATYIPSVQNGYLSWRNEQGRPNPASSYIKGEPGKDGAPGKDGQDGYTPQKGIDYFDGKDGQPGKDGVDGKDGQPGAQGPQGIQGPSGPKGEDGAPGKSAYQYAVDGGYTGTEQEFAELMASGVGGGTPGDWNQNDPTQPGYIKNRTHWEKGSVSTIEWDGSTEGRDFVHIEGGIVKVSDIIPDPSEVVGGTLIIREDENEQSIVASEASIRSYDGLYGILDIIWVAQRTDVVYEGEPLVFPSTGMYISMGDDPHALQSVTFTYGSVTVHPLDEKFIPDSIARKTDIGSGGMPLPESAVVGQFLVVSAVDENGKVTATKAVNAPSGGGLNITDDGNGNVVIS